MGNMMVEALLFSVGLVYPVHLSLSAIQSGSRDDSLQVLCYWMLHALLLTVEELLESVIVMCASRRLPGDAGTRAGALTTETTAAALTSGFRCTAS